MFSFIDGLAEITGLVQAARAGGTRLDVRQVARDSVRFSGSSDYGGSMREFAARYAAQLTRRSVVLVIGDARTNYLDPAVTAFAQIGQRAGQVTAQPRAAPVLERRRLGHRPVRAVVRRGPGVPDAAPDR